MGFQTNAANNVAQLPNAGRNDQYKPDAYINIFMPTRDGGRRKLGALALTTNKPLDKQLLDHISDADSMDAVMTQIRERLVLDFQRADGNNGVELDL